MQTYEYMNMHGIMWGMYSKLFALEEDIFKVLANQKRLEIIQLLRGRELNVTEMTEMLGLRQANLSQNLALLKQHRIVTLTRRGREVYYKLADETIADVVHMIYNFLAKENNFALTGDKSPMFPMVVDPICGMRISASQAFDSIERGDIKYYFCASGCRDKFLST